MHYPLQFEEWLILQEGKKTTIATAIATAILGFGGAHVYNVFSTKSDPPPAIAVDNIIIEIPPEATGAEISLSNFKEISESDISIEKLEIPNWLRLLVNEDVIKKEIPKTVNQYAESGYDYSYWIGSNQDKSQKVERSFANKTVIIKIDRNISVPKLKVNVYVKAYLKFKGSGSITYYY